MDIRQAVQEYFEANKEEAEEFIQLISPDILAALGGVCSEVELKEMKLTLFGPHKVEDIKPL